MGTQRKRHVLVVDNDEDVLFRLGSELKEAGYHAMTTWSGIEALRYLESYIFDSLLVDNYLPDLYIGDFLERVWGLAFRPQILVMQATPMNDTCTYGSRTFSLVDKGQAPRIIRALGCISDASGSDPTFWTH